MLRHLAHTVGANAVFTPSRKRPGPSRGSVVTTHSRNGGAQPHVRVDVAGRTVTGAIDEVQARFGFFLEYDRGTERPASMPPNSRLTTATRRAEPPRATTSDFRGAGRHDRARAEEQIAYQAFLAAERHSRPCLCC